MKCKVTSTVGTTKHYGYFDGDTQIAKCSVKEKDGYTLKNVFIEPEYRGRGLCTKFLSCVLKKYTGTIFLTVLKTNEPALKCYEHLGFKVIDEGKSTFYMQK
jgi:ribosomal protein S18 acetylase RimI-like enzyme